MATPRPRDDSYLRGLTTIDAKRDVLAADVRRLTTQQVRGAAKAATVTWITTATEIELDLWLTFSDEDFIDAVKAKGPAQPGLDSREQSQFDNQRLLRSVVRITLDPESGLGSIGSGIIVHNPPQLVTALHTFAEENMKRAIEGFPSGFDSEFKKLTESGHAKSKKPSKKEESDQENDPLKICLEVITDVDAAEPTYTIIFEGTLVKDYIRYINGRHDALVLNIPFLHSVYSYPTIFDPYRGQRISLVGFTPLLGVTSHIIPGQVTAVGPDIILVSALSAKGMSGGALACSATGAAIGFIGGSAEVADERFVTYCIPMHIVHTPDKGGMGTPLEVQQ